MARKDRNTIANGSGGKGTWSDEERQTLNICYKRWLLTDKQVNELLHRRYPNLRKEKRKYDYDHTATEYRNRFSKGRCKKWHDIDRPSKNNPSLYTDDEVDFIMGMVGQIEQVAKVGPEREEIVLVLKDPDASWPMQSGVAASLGVGAIAGDNPAQGQEEAVVSGEQAAGATQQDVESGGANEEIFTQAGGTDVEKQPEQEQADPSQPRRSARGNKGKRTQTTSSDEDVAITNEPPAKRRKTTKASPSRASKRTPSTAPASGKRPSPATTTAGKGLPSIAAAAGSSTSSAGPANPSASPRNKPSRMVHYKDLAFRPDGTVLFYPSNGLLEYVDQASKTYQAGGDAVGMSLGGAGYGYVMVCSAKACNKCPKKREYETANSA